MTVQCKESKHDCAVQGVKTWLGSARSQNMARQCKESNMTGQCKESKHDCAVQGVKTWLGSARSQNMTVQCKESKHG